MFKCVYIPCHAGMSLGSSKDPHHPPFIYLRMRSPVGEGRIRLPHGLRGSCISQGSPKKQKMCVRLCIYREILGNWFTVMEADKSKIRPKDNAKLQFNFKSPSAGRIPLGSGEAGLSSLEAFN